MNKYEKYYEQIPKYRKRAKKTGRKRANHKHKYESYIGYAEKEDRYFPITECIICGRIDKLGLMFTKKIEGGYYLSLNNLDEIKKLHPDLGIKTYKKIPFE